MENPMHRIEGHRETPLEEAARLLGIDAETVRSVAPSRLAALVLDHFSMRKLGETEAVLTLCDIVNHVPFEDEKLRIALVSRAEALLGELVGVVAEHELRMAEVERIERMLLVEGKTLDDVRSVFGGSLK